MPVLEYEDFPALLDTLRRREKPLVTYFFSNCKQNIEMVRRELSSGTLSVNDTVGFVCIPQLPFGGVGFSGQGELVAQIFEICKILSINSVETFYVDVKSI